MAKKNEYEKWVPVGSIPKRMHCEAIHDDYEGFRILLRGEYPTSPMLRLSFNPVLAYRNTDEGARLRMLHETKDLEIFPLYIVQNSSWVDWLNEESYNIYAEEGITHYSIFTPDEIIDVISQFEPKVEWLDEWE